MYRITNSAEDETSADVDLTPEEAALLERVFELLNRDAGQYAPVIKIEVRES